MIDEQRSYLERTCLKDAKKGWIPLRFQVEITPRGWASIKMVSRSDAGLRACVRKAMQFRFLSSPRGGAFLYTLAAAGGKIEKLPIASSETTPVSP